MSDQPKIAFLTAGAAGMYCGSCMHDNALARALQKTMNWDVQLIPTYTPIRTDEKDVTVDQVYFGGINLYLQQKIPIFRHIPAFLDRFLDNPRLIKRLTAKASETSPKLLGGLTVSMLKGLHGNQRKEVRRLVTWLKNDVKPDALLLTNILIAGFVPYFKQELNAPVAVMLQGDDIFLDSLPENYEKAALKEIRRLGSEIDAFVYHSQFYADKMNRWFDLDPDKSHVTPLTIDTNDFESFQTTEDSRLPKIAEEKLRIGYFARIAPEKGLHNLVDAFVRLKKEHPQLAVHLLIAGWLGDHNQGYADEQQAKLDDAGLSNDYSFLGTVDRETKIEFLNGLDIFSVPTSYEEPKGIFVLEAMACGVPVVQPSHGSFPETIAASEGGLLSEPENSDDLATKLHQLLVNAELRKSLGESGRAYVLKSRNETVMAHDVAAVFNQLGIESSSSE